MTRFKKIKLSLSKMRGSIHYLPFQYGMKTVFSVIALFIVYSILTSNGYGSDDIPMWQYILLILVLIAVISFLVWFILKLSGTESSKSTSRTGVKFSLTTPSWLKTGFNKILSFIGFLVAAGVTTYFILWVYGHGVKKIHEITGGEKEKSTQISVISIGVPKTLHFKSKDEAEFEFIAQPGMIINFDYFPCDGEIITSKGRYKIGPSYGYKGVPGGNQNTYWKCVTLGNPFEAKIFISKDSVISKK